MKICKCGNQLNKKQKKYCSSKCLYVYRTRPKGLVYKIVVENKGWHKKGEVPWNRGLTAEDERVAQYTAKGAVTKIAQNRKGEKSSNWKGGITPINLLEREKFHRTIQPKVLKRDNYTCQLCGTRGGYLHVDHIQPWGDFSELRFDMNNCRTLCQSCHYLITFGKELLQDNGWGIRV